MSIGRITVDLLARTGSFETDLGRAAKLAEKRAKEIDAAISKAGSAIGAALSAAGVAAVFFGKQVIDGLDALNDVKDATGASIENLSALEDVALRTGSSMDSVAGILVKFNNVLKEADGKNEASLALKALGLSAEELKRIDPAEALRRTAVAFQTFTADGNSARYMQELFGKSVQDAAPFLNDLAEQTKLVGKVTAEQAEAAEEFNKQLFAMQKNVIDVARDLAGPMVKAINEVSQAFRDGRAAGKSFLEIGLENYVNQVRDFWGMSKPSTGGATGSWGDPVPAASKPSLPPLPARAPKRASAPKESEFQKYLENLQKQLQATKDLSVAETVLADIESKRLKLQKGENTERLLTVARQIDAAKELAEQVKIGAEFDKALRDERLKGMEAQEDQARSLVEGNKALREEVEIIGKGAEARAAIEQARISSAIAIKQEQLALAANSQFMSRETIALEEQIRLLTERRDLLGMKGVAEKLSEDAKKAEDFAKNVGAAFESSFEKAILEGDKLSDVLGGLAKDIAALYIRNAITGPMAQAIGGAASGFDLSSIVGSMFGGFFAAGGTPPLGKVSVVGENGPELFVPNTAGTIVPNHALGGGQSVNVTINNTVGDVATISMLREAQVGTERRIAGAIDRSRRYGGALA